MGVTLLVKYNIFCTDMEIVGSTGSTLPEPSLENILRSHARLIFAFEKPEKM